MFCLNENCTHSTFSERFDFVALNGKKTNRLLDKIMNTSTKLSSVTASALLKNSSIKVCKSSICDLLKKMPTIVWFSVKKKYKLNVNFYLNILVCYAALISRCLKVIQYCLS